MFIKSYPPPAKDRYQVSIFWSPWLDRILDRKVTHTWQSGHSGDIFIATNAEDDTNSMLVLNTTHRITFPWVTPCTSVQRLTSTTVLCIHWSPTAGCLTLHPHHWLPAENIMTCWRHNFPSLMSTAYMGSNPDILGPDESAVYCIWPPAPAVLFSDFIQYSMYKYECCLLLYICVFLQR